MADGGYTRPKERNKSAGGRREVGREGQKKTGEGRRAEGESWKNITCWTVRERELRRREQDERFSERQREREEKRGDGARQSSFVRSFGKGREEKGKEGKGRREGDSREENGKRRRTVRYTGGRRTQTSRTCLNFDLTFAVRF